MSGLLFAAVFLSASVSNLVLSYRKDLIAGEPVGRRIPEMKGYT